MQSRISPDKWQKVSGYGIYEFILNRAVLQICKILYFSTIEGSFTDLALYIQSWRLKKWLGVFWNSRML